MNERYQPCIVDGERNRIQDTTTGETLPHKFWHEGIADEAAKYLNLAHDRSGAEELAKALEKIAALPKSKGSKTKANPYGEHGKRARAASAAAKHAFAHCAHIAHTALAAYRGKK